MGRVLTKHDGRGRGLLRCQGDGQLDRGATAAVASGFVMIVAGSDAVGRLVWPILSDKIGGANVFLAMFLVQATALLMIPVLGAGSFALFCVLASAVASCYRGGYATMSALTAAYYGSRDIGTIYGGILTASSVAGFGAPLLLARSADVTGTYDLALYATGGIMLVGAVIPLASRLLAPAVNSLGRHWPRQFPSLLGRSVPIAWYPWHEA